MNLLGYLLTFAIAALALRSVARAGDAVLGHVEQAAAERDRARHRPRPRARRRAWQPFTATRS